MLEAGLACVLRADPRTREVHDQPAPVTYVDDNGALRSHTFDFRAVLQCGRKIAYAVKPTSRVVSSGIERILDLIRTQVRSGFADAYVLRTERHITADRVYNARLILHSWARRNPDHVAAVAQLARTLHGAVLIRDIAETTGLGGHTLRAVACLIGDGALRLAAPTRLSPAAYVVPGSRPL